MITELVLVSFGAAAFVSGIFLQYRILTIVGIILYLIGVATTLVKDYQREQRLRDIEDIQDEMLTQLLYAVLKEDFSNVEVTIEEEKDHDDEH